MSAKRLLGFRKQVRSDISVLEYPLSSLKSNPEYSMKSVLTPIPSQTEEVNPESVIFPDSVAEYIWVHESKDRQNWYALCRMDDGAYVFFEAHCDASGFECRGTMRLYVSKSRPYLIQFALSEVAYQQYLRDTTYFKKLEHFEGLNGPNGVSLNAVPSDSQ